ncbi:MAG: DUF2442 domain-containing protein [Ignavibacteria bacterium]
MDIKIIKADYLNEYKLKLIFSDGKTNVVDFETFLLSAKNPMASKYKDIQEFKKFDLTYGDLQWNDYEMCFPIWDLYEKQSLV